VSHHAPAPPRRRRLDQIIGVLLAVVGLAVAVVAVIALQNPKGRQASRVSATVSGSARPSGGASPTRTPSVSHSAASAVRSSTSPSAATHPVPLVVLDSTGNPSLADTAAARLRAGGWTVASTDELTNDILSTVAYFDPDSPGAQQAALQLQQQFPAIKRVVARFAELPSGPIVVVLTSDYS
jgi:LytR cell envelope-related transcriptional attenuator